jgi:selenocysteine lyase/cysteine desulfurase
MPAQPAIVQPRSTKYSPASTAGPQHRLNLEGVAIRFGQHCAHPLLPHSGLAATCRASLAFYNTHAEIERFIAALNKVRKLLG